MNPLSPTARHLARMLLLLETPAVHVPAESQGNPPVRSSAATMMVCEKLRVVLTVFAGTYGFKSLLSRALVQAKAQVPSLAEVTVLPNGSLAGLDQLIDETAHMPDGTGGEILVARLLDLLIIFMGVSLTLTLIRGAWPDVSPEKFNPGSEELT